jgi:Zn-dependent protease with chaperone function
MTTSVPAPRPRRTFPEISAVSWEHPADRAALQALRAVPGVDEVIRKVLALLGGERGVRLLFQGNAIRVGPSQFPRLWHLHTEVTTTFDWADVPELYVSQTPFFNAGAYGIDKPFIVIHSAAIELLDDDELRVLLAHELGHVMSGHALYRTIAAILALISLGALPMLASLAVLPVRLAFLEWSRKSELSSDRAGLLGGGMVECVVDAGWTTSVRASPRLTACVASRSASRTLRPRPTASVPAISKDRTAPYACIWC